MPDLDDTIEADAAKPAEAEVDGQKVKKRPLTELIEADKYLEGKTALAGENQNGGPISGWGRVRMARGVPPGAS